jgi:hypothetical protein
MRWLGIAAVVLIAFAGAGCTLDTISITADSNQRVAEPTKKLTSPSAFGPRFSAAFHFDNGSCVIGNSPVGECLRLESPSKLGNSVSFVALCIIDGSPCAIPRVTNPATLGSSAQSPTKGLINNAIAGINDIDAALVIFFQFPMIKIGMYLLPQPGATGRQKAVLTGFDENGIRITSAATNIPTDAPIFLGISSTKSLRRATLKYEADLPELIDDLYVEPSCPAIGPNIQEGQPLNASLLVNRVVHGSVRTRIAANIINTGNNTGRDFPILFRVYRGPRPIQESNLIFEETKVVRSLGANRTMKAAVFWFPPGIGSYIIGYLPPIGPIFFPRECFGTPFVSFISDEVVVD